MTNYQPPHLFDEFFLVRPQPAEHLVPAAPVGVVGCSTATATATATVTVTVTGPALAQVAVITAAIAVAAAL